LLTSYPGNVSTLGAKASTGILVDNNGNAGNVSQIGLGYTFSSTYHPVAIAAITDSGSGSTRADLHFATRSLTTDSAPETRMIIKNDGKVGIGTTSPARPLDVNGSVRLSSGSVIEFGGIVTNFITGDNSNNYLAFGTNSSERARIDSSGRLLVGTVNAPAGAPAGSVTAKGGVYLQSPSGTWFAVGVSDSGQLSATQVALVKRDV
jgi:hypothetical protein